DHRPRLRGDSPLPEEFAVVPPRDEADLLRVGLFCDGETRFAGERPDFSLPEPSDREEDPPHPLSGDGEELVGLVLRPVGRAAQADLLAGDLEAGVVAGREGLRAEAPGDVEEGAELDLPVAPRAGVRREPVAVSVDEPLDQALELRG